jgi:cytochrome P450
MEQRRISPQHDFPSDLLQAVEEEQVQLNDAEILGLFLSLISAGVETTTAAIGMAVYHLLKERNFWEAIQQEPALIPRMVEEILRLDGPSLGLFRLTTEEVVLNGVMIPKDAMLYLMFGSANHDETIFAQGDTFDPYRENLNRHLAFSYGMHFCVGAPLARLELRVALEELSQRLPSLRLVPGQPLSYVPSLSVRGPLRLLVEWDPNQLTQHPL